MISCNIYLLKFSFIYHTFTKVKRAERRIHVNLLHVPNFTIISVGILLCLTFADLNFPIGQILRYFMFPRWNLNCWKALTDIQFLYMMIIIVLEKKTGLFINFCGILYLNGLEGLWTSVEWVNRSLEPLQKLWELFFIKLRKVHVFSSWTDKNGHTETVFSAIPLKPSNRIK